MSPKSPNSEPAFPNGPRLNTPECLAEFCEAFPALSVAKIIEGLQSFEEVESLEHEGETLGALRCANNCQRTAIFILNAEGLALAEEEYAVAGDCTKEINREFLTWLSVRNEVNDI